MQLINPQKTSLATILWAVLFFGLPGQLLGVNTDVSISLLDGSSISGTFLSADSARANIQTKSGPIEKLSGDIGRINFSNRMMPQSPPVELFLLDGSKVFGNKLSGKSSGWLLADVGGNEIAIPAKSLKAAKLKPIAKELAAAWQTAIVETKTADAVIVARPGNTFDRINGVIVQVQEASIAFDLDGQQIDIPIEKLAGLVWFQRDLERVKPTIEVSLTDHSIWLAESLTVKAEILELKTMLGQSVTIPLSKVVSIDYSTANIRWLCDVESLEAIAEKAIEFKSPIASLDRALAPRFVVNGRAPLPTSTAADKDLYFPSPGHYMFRVPSGFASFQCRVERTDEGSQRTDLVLEVWQDDQKVSEHPLAHNADFTDVSLALKPEKKTKLAVVCKSKLMIGTEVTWKQPRLKR